MTIAELFVNIGLKGDSSVSRGLAGVQKGLGEVQSSGLAAKAAILAVIYGLERMTGAAAEQGRSLQQFANFTGLGTEGLQKLDLAARRAGASAGETEASVRGMQKAMAEVRFGGGPPVGAAAIGRVVGGFDINQLANPYYVINKVREYLAKTKDPVDFQNKAVTSLGVSEGLLAALRSKKFKPEEIKANDIMSASELSKLDDINGKWVSFWNTLNLFRNKQVSVFGPGVLDELAEALKLMTSFTKAIEEFSKTETGVTTMKAAFVALGAALVTFGSPLVALSTAIAGLITLMGEWQKRKEGKESFFDFFLGEKGNKKGIIETTGDSIKKMFGGGQLGGPLNYGTGQFYLPFSPSAESAMSGAGAIPSGPAQQTVNNDNSDNRTVSVTFQGASKDSMPDAEQRIKRILQQTRNSQGKAGVQSQ